MKDLKTTAAILQKKCNEGETALLDIKHATQDLTDDINEFQQYTEDLYYMLKKAVAINCARKFSKCE